MKLLVAWIGKTKEPAVNTLAAEYLRRLARYAPAEGEEFASEAALLKALAKERTPPTLVLLDRAGKQLSSEDLARFLARHEEQGTRALLFAIGPADGFSEEARRAAAFKLSFGPITLPHELARVVLLEQLYRAFTILKGHPYHIGH